MLFNSLPKLNKLIKTAKWLIYCSTTITTSTSTAILYIVKTTLNRQTVPEGHHIAGFPRRVPSTPYAGPSSGLPLALVSILALPSRAVTGVPLRRCKEATTMLPPRTGQPAISLYPSSISPVVVDLYEEKTPIPASGLSTMSALGKVTWPPCAAAWQNNQAEATRSPVWNLAWPWKLVLHRKEDDRY